MAVYTKLSENNLKDFFSKYNLGKLLKFQGIQEGIENSNYFVKTDSGKFILTVYEKRVEEKDLPFFMGLMKNIFNKNFPSPEPIINKNGNYITEIFGKKAAVVSFLEGASKKNLTPAYKYYFFAIIIRQKNNVSNRKFKYKNKRISLDMVEIMVLVSSETVTEQGNTLWSIPVGFQSL